VTLLAIGLVLLALVLVGVPIAIALGCVAVLAMVTGPGGLGALPNAALVMYSGATSFPLIAIPLFILAGAIMNGSGISRRLIAFASALVGFVRGGLSMVTISASLFFAEISGSAVADVAALGSILIPAMRRKGYSRSFAAAVTSSSATLAVIIPPSIPMILYGVMSGSSIVELFVAGIVPGVLGGLLMMFVAYLLARRYDFPREEMFRLQRVWTTFREAGWALLLPVIILGGIFSGWVTATEGAGLAVVAAMVIGGVVYRELSWGHLRKAMIEAGSQTAVVMLLVAASALLGDYLTEVRLPQQVAAGILGVTQDRWAILLLLNAFFLVIGLFLHSAAAIILVVPIVMPLVQTAGIDPVHFGLVVTLNLGIGQQTPPVASVLVTACSVAKADIWQVSKVNVFFVAVLLAVLLLVTYVPAVPMALVELLYR
jgi:tripartite ATP-independent transporter DctM subunit